MTDRDLLRAHIDLREVDRLGAFLGRYQESLVRFVANYLRDDTVARDIVQEMFRRVARHPKRLLEVTSCHNRLLSMARNLSVDHLRKKIRRRKHTGAGQPGSEVFRGGLFQHRLVELALSQELLQTRVLLLELS